MYKAFQSVLPMNKRQLKIGVLCPYSSFYPYLSQEFMEGIYSAIPEKLRPSFQIIPEFIHQGHPSALKAAIQKLLHFERVDVLTGIINYRALAEFIPQLEKHTGIVILADMGEYLPYQEHLNSSLFFNSFHYWQAETALGYWAQKNFGSKGSVLMPIYDGGYHLHSAFRQGLLSAENVPLDYVVIRHSEEPTYNLEYALTEYLQKYKSERPSFIHAIFNGIEAQQFFARYHKEGLHKEIPLIVNSHMASHEVLKDLTHLDMTFYAASLWDINTDTLANQQFKQAYTLLSGGERPTSFSLLGHEIGLALQSVSPALLKRDFATVKTQLKTEKIMSPRGERSLCQSMEVPLPMISIEKVVIAQGKVRKIAIDQGRALPYHHQLYEEIRKENVSGWLNNYLSV